MKLCSIEKTDIKNTLLQLLFQILMQSQRAVQYLSLLFALYFLTLETIFPIYYRERKNE